MNTSFALTTCAVVVMLIGNLAVMVDRSQRETETEHQPVANKVTNKVTDKVTNDVVNNTANRVTTIETEVYRVVCVEEKTGYCKEYSVRRINRE